MADAPLTGQTCEAIQQCIQRAGETGDWSDIKTVFLALSLLLNAIGLTYTFLSSRKNRQSDLRLSRFDTYIRVPIEKRLDDLDEVTSIINGAMLAPQIEKRREALVDAQREITPAVFRKLSDALQSADNADYVSGHDWVDISDKSSDEILTAFDRINNQANSSERVRSGIVRIEKIIQDLRQEIRTRLDREAERIRG